MKKISVMLCMCLSLVWLLPTPASADAEIAKVTVRTEPSNPPVMMKIADISAVVSSNNASIDSVSWYDSAGNLDTDTVDNCVYTVQIRVSAPEGYVFSENVEGAINNSSATVSRAPDGSYLDLSRTVEPSLLAPTVWWSPTSETVDEGGLASFAATASPYYSSAKWNLISPTGSTTDISTVKDKFPGVTYTVDESIGRLNIHNVTADMDGWKVSCTFTGPGGSATTSSAAIKVKGAVAASPSPSPTATPLPEADPSPSQPPAGDGHEHQFSTSWSSDDSGHWHACPCGEKGDLAAHTFTWTMLQKATKKQPGQEKGVCSVCGYESLRSVEYEKSPASGGSLLTIILYVVAGVVVLALILMIVQSVSDRKRRRRRKRNNRRRY